MKILVSENTKVTISLGILIAMFVFLISLTVTAVGWKTKIEHRISALESHRIVMLENFENYNNDVEALMIRQLEQDALFAEIRTDLKWIRMVLETK